MARGHRLAAATAERRAHPVHGDGVVRTRRRGSPQRKQPSLFQRRTVRAIRRSAAGMRAILGALLVPRFFEPQVFDKWDKTTKPAWN